MFSGIVEVAGVKGWQHRSRRTMMAIMDCDSCAIYSDSLDWRMHQREKDQWKTLGCILFLDYDDYRKEVHSIPFVRNLFFCMNASRVLRASGCSCFSCKRPVRYLIEEEEERTSIDLAKTREEESLPKKRKKKKWTSVSLSLFLPRISLKSSSIERHLLTTSLLAR